MGFSQGFSQIECDFLISTACGIIRARLNGIKFFGGEVPSIIVPPLPGLTAHAGCFVSLHTRQTHALRGCIGRMDADAPIIQSLQSAAMGVLEDPRFVHDRVTAAELPDLDIELSIIGPPEPARNPLDFDLLTDGIQLELNDRLGVFLPQVARETGWNREKLLERLCSEKMGLPGDSWKDPRATLRKFPVTIIGPSPFILAPT